MLGSPAESLEAEDADEEEDNDQDPDIDLSVLDNFQRLAEGVPMPMLYEGSRCTVRNFVAKLQYFIAKNGLTDVAVGDLLDLFRTTLPKQNRCPPSVHKLAKVTKEEFGSPRLDFDRLCTY